MGEFIKATVSLGVDRQIWRVFPALIFWLAALTLAITAQSPTHPELQHDSQVTYSKDIAPILIASCVTCHRPGQSAPFSLLTYEDVRPRSQQIVQAIVRREMPPWKPEPGYGEFADPRRLSDDEVATFQRWAANGFPRGDSTSMPPMPTSKGGWQLGTPDLVLDLPEPYVLAPGREDIFRTFVIPIQTTALRYVRAVEFNPQSPRIVHHANIKIDRSPFSRRWDEEDPLPGYAGGGSREARFPDGHFLGWTPGQSPRIPPSGMSWRLDPKSDLVVELHLMPQERPQELRFSVGLFFTDQSPLRMPYMLRLGRQDIDILPGDRSYVNVDSFTLPVDVLLLSVQPHAHYLAREIRGVAPLPDGSRQDLIYIKDWDFYWQDVYQYSRPVSLPKGTTIEMRYTYDNSTSNRRNPHRPPKRVRFGQTSVSEMGSLWLQVLPDNLTDLELLDREFSPKLLRDDIAGNEKWLEAEPKNARLRAELAACYVEAGRLDAAVAQLEEALRIERTPGRYYDLGLVLLQQRNFALSRDAFLRALDLKPNFAEAMLNLGVAAHAQGRLDEAINYYMQSAAHGLDDGDLNYNLGRALAAAGRHQEAIVRYRRTVEIEPENAEARRALGHALAGAKQEKTAIAEYRKALEIEPEMPAASIELAWILTSVNPPELRDVPEAVRLAERAAELTQHREASILDVLAVAYLASGQIDRAIETAEGALELATRAGDSELIVQLRLRLDFYRKQKR
jgi:tetratricopeptide (TPR) repeat protein